MNAKRPSLVALTTTIAALAVSPGAHAWTVTSQHELSESAELNVTCGATSAVATGRYTGRRLLIVNGFPKEFFFTYPVRIALTKPQLCGKPHPATKCLRRG